MNESKCCVGSNGRIENGGGTTAGTQAVNTSGTWSSGWCMYRLPCGYCTQLDRPCPMQGSGYTPTWKYEITCKADG